MLMFAFNPYGIKKFVIGILFIGLLYILVLILLTWYKNPIQTKINNELDNVLIISDYFSWQIFGFVYTTFHLELIRS